MLEEPIEKELDKEGFKLIRNNLWMKKGINKITIKSRCSNCGIFLETNSSKLLFNYDIPCNRCKTTKQIKINLRRER